MKAILVRHPLQITLETDGEAWTQGSTVKGRIHYQNMGGEASSVAGDFGAIYPTLVKQVREGTLPTSKSAHEVDLPASFEVAAGEEMVFDYEFSLPTDAPITDKASGLFFYFGAREGKHSSLALQVNPHQRIAEMLENIELFLRFKTKSIKAKKDKIEIKLAPPPSKEFAGVDALTLLTKFVDEKIQLDFQVKVKKLDYSEASTQMAPSMQKGVVKFSETLSPSDYLIFGKAFNGEKVAAMIDKSLESVKTKSII